MQLHQRLPEGRHPARGCAQPGSVSRAAEAEAQADPSSHVLSPCSGSAPSQPMTDLERQDKSSQITRLRAGQWGRLEVSYSVSLQSFKLCKLGTSIVEVVKGNRVPKGAQKRI